MIISHRDFLESMLPLKEFREGQGWSVALIDAEDLYDEFSFGVKNPRALKDFLAKAKTDWRKAPRFLLLVGDASFDPRNYLGFEDFDFVPTKLVDTKYLTTASDDWFSDFDGDGLAEMAVGRMPVRTPEEARTVVAKVIGYELAEADSWAKEALMVADRNDGFDFDAAIEQVAGLLPEAVTTWEISLDETNDETARNALLQCINEGQLLVNYIGHGSVEILRGRAPDLGRRPVADQRETSALFCPHDLPERPFP